MRVSVFLVLVAITCVTTLSSSVFAEKYLRSGDVDDQNHRIESRKLSSTDDKSELNTHTISRRLPPLPLAGPKIPHRLILPEAVAKKTGKMATFKKILFVLLGAALGGLIWGNIDGAIGIKQ